LGDYLSRHPNIALAAALVLALTGGSQRWRTFTAIAIFALGYLGGLALIFIVSFVSGFPANAR